MQAILDWSEVWSLIIPLVFLLRSRIQPAVNRPVAGYVIAALIINVAANIIWKLRLIEYNGQVYNGFLYNLHSVVRFLLFNAYFIHLQPPRFRRSGKVLRIAFILFVVINFGFFEGFYDHLSPFSSRILSVEAGLLLFLCMQFYIARLKDDTVISLRQPEIWIITGLCLYVAINFFIFLLYDQLSRQPGSFASNLWDVHNISYILLNLSLAKAFYESGKQ